MSKTYNVGIVGTGFIARQVARCLELSSAPLRVSSVLTRRPDTSIDGFDDSVITRSIDDFIASCDVVFEASGDAIHATDVIESAVAQKRPVTTINPEFHVTTGSYFVGKGYVSEAIGDQPGCLAQLYREAKEMGFDVHALVNIKGFLNPNPPESDMKYWSEKQDLAFDQTVSFTDGTKLQIEQVFVANGLGAELYQEGMIGERVEQIESCDHLVDASKELKATVSDYVLASGAPPGVFVVANHPVFDEFEGYLPFSKLRTTGGKGYVLMRPYHLCAVEVIRSLIAMVRGDDILLDNGATPRFGVAAVAKRDIKAGEPIDKALGSLDFRGRGVRISDRPEHVPICLLKDAKVTQDIAAESVVTFDDVTLPDSRAAQIYREILANISAN